MFSSFILESIFIYLIRSVSNCAGYIKRSPELEEPEYIMVGTDKQKEWSMTNTTGERKKIGYNKNTNGRHRGVR